MNILFLAPRLPLPADTGGKIRTWNILKQLGKFAQVRLVCFSFEQKDKEFARDIERSGINVTLVPALDRGYSHKVVQSVLNPYPVSIAKYYSEDMEAVLTELNETNRFDAVHIDHLHMAHYQKCFDGVPCVIDEHNVEYRILERCAAVEKSFVKRMVFKNQAAKMKRFEAASIKKAAAYLAVSEDDKKLLDQLRGDGRAGYVVPNGVDTEYFRAQQSESKGSLNADIRGLHADVRGYDIKNPRKSAFDSRSSAFKESDPTSQDTGHKTQEEAVVFTGSMDWMPNDDAVTYYIEKVLPLIWQKRPGVKFYVVGKGPSARLQAHARQEPRVICTGRVDDVRPYVERSQVFVCPLRIGGGTRLKILEAMSMSKAVISTSIGAEGISYTEDKNICLADNAEVFAQKVVAMLGDRFKQESLGVEGRKLVLEHYDWNIIGKRLGEIYETVKK